MKRNLRGFGVDLISDIPFSVTQMAAVLVNASFVNMTLSESKLYLKIQLLII